MSKTNVLVWNEVDWTKVHNRVRRYQRRIFKASAMGNQALVHKLQIKLLNSLDAKLVSVQRVTTLNKNKKTGFSSTSSIQKMNLVYTLKLDGKAVSTPKPNTKKTKKRDSILTIKDKAKQFLVKLVLEPEWEARFQELLDYRTKHGDCKVPQHYKENKALGKWVAKQREQHKLLKKGQHSFLTPYRLEKLNAVGFVWSVRSSLDTNPDEEVKLPDHVPGVLPAAAAPAAAAAAAAIAAAKEDTIETKAAVAVVPEQVTAKEEDLITEV